MPIVIKEIQVNTVMEKKVILPPDISESVYRQLKSEVLRELTEELRRRETMERPKDER